MKRYGMLKILFICKRRISYGISYGLLNSARFAAAALDRLPGVQAKVVDVIDNNFIDSEVTRFRPNIVIIEALWVVPEKFPILLRLHPTVRWIVRIHSKPTFIANEGIAMDWLAKYSDVADYFDNFHIASNNKEFAKCLSTTFSTKVLYTPNVYHPVCRKRTKLSESERSIHIGCFGAVRPMKNHLAQALAAIKFAEEKRKHLFFYINGDRQEQRGDEVLKNLRALFDRTTRSTLVERPWSSHEVFLYFVAQMDIGMQVSLSETFNIVAADFVSLGVPIVTCPDIEWTPSLMHADPTSIDDIVKKLHRAWRTRHWMPTLARLKLWWHNRRAMSAWERVIS